MDEENNNQGQEIQETEDTAQKVQQEAQDTVQGVKDSASLAKNAASGNIAGAAKDAVNLAKNKTFRKKMIIKTALSILGPILFVIIVASLVVGVFDAVGDGIQSAWEAVKDFFTIDLSNDLEIKVTDDALNTMIEAIESQGISLDDLHLMGDKADYNDPEVEEKNKEALRKYLREFYVAQAVTQTLYPGESLIDQILGKTYGTVYVQRTKEDDTDLSKVTQLEYIPYEKMVEKQNKANYGGDPTTDSLDNFLFIGDSRTVGPKTNLEDLGKNNSVAAVSASMPSHWKNITSKDGANSVTEAVNGTTVTLPSASSVKGISVSLGANGASYQIEQMKQVLENLLNRYPDIPIFVNEVFKVGKNYSYGSITASNYNTTINTYNNKLEALCNENSRLIYINISTGLYDDEGYLKSDYTSDSLHLNSAGNEVLVKNIKTAILTSGAVEGKGTSEPDPSDREIDNIMKYFSINPENDKLVVANTTTTKIVQNGSTTKDETIIGLTEIDYKSVISQYTTSMNFLVYLTMVTQNPEFASAVADLVKDSDIRLTIMDRVTTSITNEERNYTLNTKWIEKVEHTSYDNWDTEHIAPYTTYTYEERTSSEDKTDTTETTVISTTPVPAINYAKTWFSEQTIEYTKKDTPVTYSEPYSTDPNNENEPSISGEGSRATWITNDITTITSGSGSSVYEQGTRGDVKSRIGEKPDQDPSYESFVDLLDKEFRIPNSSRVENESAGGNLVSGAEIFFSLLQKDASSQNLENIMRYALYMYTGKSYGVTDLDFLKVFNIRQFTTAGRNGGIEEILKSYENEALRQYMNGQSTDYSSVSNYVTQDKTQYKMYYTSYDGCLNFSYGIMVRSKSGTLNNEAYFAAEGLNLQELVNRYDSGQEVLVDAEALDRIFKQIVKDKKDNIKNILEEKGVSLKTNQLDALVNVAYQYGNCGQYISGENNIANLYKTYYETGNTETFKQKAVAQTGSGGLAHFFTGNEFKTRKEYNWILFNEGRYILSNGEEISAGSSEVVAFAQQFIGENHSRFTSYNPTNGVPDIWWGADWCAMFVSYCYNECGLIPNVLQEPYAGCSTEVYNLKGRGEFIEASTGYIPQPGDIVFFTKTNGSTYYHTGLVVSCDGTRVYTIEGNTSTSSTNPYWMGSKVAEDSYSMTDTRLGGYFSINGN